MGSGGVAIAALPTVICLKVPFSDGLGGAMSPFVGIAGVIMTFVAFVMQVRANEIQREQLTNSEAMIALAY